MVGLIIGRFQPCHTGHVDLIKKTLDQVGLLVIAIGSSNRRGSLKNPFSFEERKEILLKNIGNLKNYVIIVPLCDYYSQERWEEELSRIIVSYGVKKIFYHDKKDGSSDWVSKVSFDNVEKINIEQNHSISATEIREHNQLLQNYVSYQQAKDYITYKNSVKHYREQFINPYSKTQVFYAVDCLITYSDAVLLIQRKGTFGNKLYALIGGFVDEGEEAYDAVVREVREEIGFDISGYNHYDYYYDSPERSDRGRIITRVFHIELDKEDMIQLVDTINKFNGNSEVEGVFLCSKMMFHDHFQYQMFADHAMIISDLVWS